MGDALISSLAMPGPSSDLLTQPAAVPFLIAAGAALLLAGRWLFWLCVGVAGAVGGLWVVTELLDLEPGLPTLVAVVAAGLAGALLAVLVQKVAVVLAGFVAGVWGSAALLEVLPATPALLEPELARIGLLLVAGVLGGLLAFRLFEAALVVLSSLVGGLLIVFTSGLEGAAALAVGALLVGVGLWFQSRRVRRRRRG